MAGKKQSSFYDDFQARTEAQNQLNQSILNGTRKDDIIGFDRGQAIIRVGDHYFNAEILLANKSDGTRQFYDIINLSEKKIQSSFQTGRTSANTVDRSNKTVSNNSIFNPKGNVNSKYSVDTDSSMNIDSWINEAPIDEEKIIAGALKEWARSMGLPTWQYGDVIANTIDEIISREMDDNDFNHDIGTDYPFDTNSSIDIDEWIDESQDENIMKEALKEWERSLEISKWQQSDVISNAIDDILRREMGDYDSGIDTSYRSYNDMQDIPHGARDISPDEQLINQMAIYNMAGIPISGVDMQLIETLRDDAGRYPSVNELKALFEMLRKRRQRQIFG